MDVTPGGTIQLYGAALEFQVKLPGIIGIVTIAEFALSALYPIEFSATARNTYIFPGAKQLTVIVPPVACNGPGLRPLVATVLEGIYCVWVG